MQQARDNLAPPTRHLNHSSQSRQPRRLDRLGQALRSPCRVGTALPDECHRFEEHGRQHLSHETPVIERELPA